MKIIWDDLKRQANIDKHLLDFADVVRFDWRTAKISQARSDTDGRPGLKAVGHFDHKISVVIFSLLGTEAMSVISFRSASAKESIGFHDSQGNDQGIAAGSWLYARRRARAGRAVSTRICGRCPGCEMITSARGHGRRRWARRSRPVPEDRRRMRAERSASASASCLESNSGRFQLRSQWPRRSVQANLDSR